MSNRRKIKPAQGKPRRDKGDPSGGAGLPVQLDAWSWREARGKSYSTKPTRGAMRPSRGGYRPGAVG